MKKSRRMEDFEPASLIVIAEGISNKEPSVCVPSYYRTKSKWNKMAPHVVYLGKYQCKKRGEAPCSDLPEGIDLRDFEQKGRNMAVFHESTDYRFPI